MVDNVTLPGTGSVVATDDDGTAQHQYVKLEWGPDNTQTKVDTASGKPLPVQLRSPTGVDLTGSAGTASAAVVTVQGIASGTVVPVSGTVTSNAGTNLNTSALALETGGNLATVVTNTGRIPSQGQALAAASLPVVLTAAQITTLTPLATVAVTQSGSWSLTANQSINNAQINGVTPLMGNGVTGTGSQRVTIASDNTAFSVNAVQSGTWNIGTVTTLPALVAGSALIGKVSIDQTTPGTTDSVSLKSLAFASIVTLTRTADTNVYAANDVIGAATGATAALTFSSMGPSGKEILITSAALEIDASALISGETSYRLYLYNVTPPSATGDNGAWDLPSGDRASFLGFIDLGTPVDLGSTLYVENNGLNKQLTLSGTSIFAYLVTNAAYTPTSARVYKITLHSVAV